MPRQKRPNSYWYAYVDSVSAYGTTGQLEQARQALAELNKVRPNFTVQAYGQLVYSISTNPQFRREIDDIAVPTRRIGEKDGDLRTDLGVCAGQLLDEDAAARRELGALLWERGDSERALLMLHAGLGLRDVRDDGLDALSSADLELAVAFAGARVEHPQSLAAAEDMTQRKANPWFVRGTSTS